VGTAAAKAEAENNPMIAAVNRCATQKQPRKDNRPKTTTQNRPPKSTTQNQVRQQGSRAAGEVARSTQGGSVVRKEFLVQRAGSSPSAVLRMTVCF
jgi:hypothetical protein